METSRLFLTDLPSNVTEKDIRRFFQDYADVQKVEIKTKENLVDSENVKVIAFVTLSINSSDLQYCLKETNWQKLNGCRIKVTVAKESFLERLKRERAEAEEKKNEVEPIASDKFAFTDNRENSRKIFDEHAELDEDEIAPELLVTKKRAASSLRNGKIVIQSYDNAPVHVIEAKKLNKTSNKNSPADLKRKESVNKKKQEYQQKKSTIQKSLAGLDGSLPKKIKFSNSDEEDTNNADTKVHKSQVDLFSGDEDETLELEEKHFGSKGEKLFKLQGKQSLDPRFKMGEQFIDDGDDSKGTKNKGVENSENERDWQMGILEEVIGVKLNTETLKEKASRSKKMLRYDPSKEDHKKYLRTNNEDLNENVKNQNEKSNDDSKQTDTHEVSKEVFYVVKDTLQDSLKSRGEGFSLLQMFGKVDVLKEREEQLKHVSSEKILINKATKNMTQPFKYDSSSESDNEEQLEASMKDTKNKTASKKKVIVESFFIPKHDVRLKEGAKFFKMETKKEDNYDEVRDRLSILIKTKIRKAMKNKPNHKNRNK